MTKPAAYFFLALVWLAGLSPSAGLAAEDYTFALSGDILLRAGTIEYDHVRQRVEALDGVEISWREYFLTANSASYSEVDGVIEALGDVVIYEPSGTRLYAVKAIMRRDFITGQLESPLLILPDGSRLAASGAARLGASGDVLLNAAYTPCAPCRDNPDAAPLWQVRARKAVHSSAGQTVSYRDAVIEILGVPVFYLPIFWHPEPGVKRKSGLLPPRLSFSDHLGVHLALPIFVPLSLPRALFGGQTMDFTFRPVIATENSEIFEGEWRHTLAGGFYSLAGSITDTQPESGVIGGTRGHIFGRGRFPIGAFGRWGFDVQSASDDTYLRLYDYHEGTDLASRAFFEWTHGGTDFDLTLWRFDNLLPAPGEDNSVLALPVASYRYDYGAPFVGGRLSLAGNFAALRRDAEERNYYRLSLNSVWDRNFIDGLGSTWLAQLAFGGDLYRLETDGESDYQTRVMPRLGLEWRFPFVRHGEASSQLLEPIIQLAYTPDDNTDDTLPNEDSLDTELNAGNIFSFSRFAGFDRIESGALVNFGLRFGIYGEGGGEFSLLAGQVLRFKDDDDEEIAGLSGKSSDYVGGLEIVWPGLGHFRQEVRLDKDDLALRQNSADVEFFWNPLALFMGYTELEREEREKREEVNFGAAVSLPADWRVYGGVRYNLAGKVSVIQRGGLRYQGDCLGLDISYERDFGRDREIQPETRIIFRLILKNLGSTRSSVSLGGGGGVLQ